MPVQLAHMYSILENDSRRAAPDSRAGTAYVDHEVAQVGLNRNLFCMRRALEMLGIVGFESRRVGARNMR